MALTDETKNNVQVPEDDIIDINLDGIKRKRFRINGIPGAIIELNVSDLGIVDRLEKGMQKPDSRMNVQQILCCHKYAARLPYQGQSAPSKYTASQHA